ncbi:hypothetical protein Lal_00007542 [Lupinus albus]|nr:hypothetical protein Lal_00007542 [Lupinus albus]
MSTSRPFDMIMDLNDSKYLWKIAVRITDIWYVQLPPKPGHLEMILMDSKGDRIQVSVRKDQFNEWREHLVESSTYVMHNFNVMHNDIQFKACDHVYRMQFTAGTTLKQREFPDIPEWEYDFKKFGDILDGNGRNNLLIDIIGAFDKVIFSQTQGNLKKVVFSLKDFSGDFINCTMWESHATKFEKHYNNHCNVEPMIILLTHARIKEGQDDDNFVHSNYPHSISNSWCGSKILIGEEIPNIDKYKQSLSCDTLSHSNSQMSQYSNLSDDERFMYKAEVKSITEISAITSSEEITCVTVGTTAMFVVGKHGWYYEGCTKCTKKTDVKDGPFTCNIMSLSHPFDMITDVNDSKHFWKIAVRITKLWFVQKPPKSGHLEMVLMDSKGHKIQVSVVKEDFIRWRNYLVEYDTYMMQNFDVMLNDCEFKACDHLYRMEFNANTIVERLICPAIPLFEYEFKKFAEIVAGQFSSYLLIEIIGVVEYKSIFSQTETKLKKCQVHVVDQSDCPTIVSSSWCGSKLLIGEEINDIAKYKQRFSSLPLWFDQFSEGQCQLPSPQAVSFTAEHDPDHLEVITSSKRMWGELDLDLAQSPLQSSSGISSSNVAKHMKTK